TLAPKHDSFRVDKKAIQEVLKTQTKGEPCLFCPAFDWRRIRAAVKELPTVIKLEDKSPFEVRYSDIDPTKALGIQPKESDDDLFDKAMQISGRQAGQPVQRQVPNVRYTDVAGQDAALEALQSVVELPLRHAAYFEALGVAPQTGILL